jgi:hypothetical protein
VFEFGQRAQLRKIGNELKGASLQEVVEGFADSQFLKPPAIKYDRNIYKTNSRGISTRLTRDTTV